MTKEEHWAMRKEYHEKARAALSEFTQFGVPSDERKPIDWQKWDDYKRFNRESNKHFGIWRRMK